MITDDLFVIALFGLILFFTKYFSVNGSFYVEVVVVGVFFIAIFEVEGELLYVGETFL